MLLIDDPAVNFGLVCPVKPSLQTHVQLSRPFRESHRPPLSLRRLEYYFDYVGNLIWRKVLIGFVIMASILIGVRRREPPSYEFTPVIVAED